MIWKDVGEVSAKLTSRARAKARAKARVDRVQLQSTLDDIVFLGEVLTKGLSRHVIAALFVVDGLRRAMRCNALRCDGSR